MATPEHHHYSGLDCVHRGSTCTSDDCQWAIDAGILPLHADCSPQHGTCSREECGLPTVDDDVCWWCRNADAGTYLARP